jgi:hypothetical protein
MLSNFMANALMMWLNYLLVPFAVRQSLILETQVTMQQAVQTCNVMSYLSAVKSFTNCHKQTVYALQCDQMKGFDYLHPQGFYDVILAYGLPKEIIDIDKVVQSYAPEENKHGYQKRCRRTLRYLSEWHLGTQAQSL